MPVLKPGARRVFDICCFAVGALAALAAHLAMALSRFGTNDFDDPIRMLQPLYAARGLTPYIDYGFLYPPGLAWFYGNLLGLRDADSASVAVALVNLLLAGLCAGQMARLFPQRRARAAGAALLVLGGIMPLMTQLVAVERHGMLLLPLILLLLAEIALRGASAARLGCLAVLALIGVLIRWDRILFTAIMECGWACALWLYGFLQRGPHKTQARAAALGMAKAAIAMLAGGLLGIAVMMGHAAATGAAPETQLFVFELPLLILPFRRLPLPLPIGENLQWLANVIAMLALAASMLVALAKRQSKPVFAYIVQAGIWLAACAALLPYTFTRADFTHFLPLAGLLGAALLAALMASPSRAANWFLLGALALLLFPSCERAAYALTHPLPGDRVADRIRNCTDLFPQDASSLFVGQTSYARYISNMTIFYLTRPDLRPAAPFISDEPGVQNSCAFGAQIADDLARAPRPLVLVLDTNQIVGVEDNLTATMTSCGKIENAVAALSPVFLGQCQVEGRNFNVGVVR